MRDDLRFAFRSLRSSKTFTAVALMVLALGIGASTAIFSVVDAVVLRGLPFDEHDRLVAVGERRPPGPNPDPSRDPEAVQSIAPQNYMDWVAMQQAFESIAAIAGGAVTLREPGAEPEDLRSQRVTASFFDVLRTRPALGQPFSKQTETDGQHQVVVLSDRLWRRRFGGDPALVGKTIPLEGGAYQVVGIMPADFEYPVGAVRPTDVWVPYVVPEHERIRHQGSFSVYLQSIARLKPGITLPQAQSDMDRIARAITAANPEWNKDSLAGVRPLIDHLVGARTRSWMLMLLGAVAIVLLIACANVANLLLARASTREREVGIRAALGASRWRLVRQLLVESLVLSVLGTFLAIFLAAWGVQILKAAMPDGVPRVATISVDPRVLAAAAAMAVITGIIFGIVPALQVSRPNLTNALREGARGASTSAGRQRMRSALVVIEVALAVVLLVGASLFIGSFVTLMRIDLGFNPSNVLTAQVSPRVDFSKNPDLSASFVEIVDRLSRAPGVRDASLITGGMPLGGSMSKTSLTVPGGTKIDNDNGISIRYVTAAYHHAIGIPLRSGRLFDERDRRGSPNVAILNDAAARKYFPGQSPLGRTVSVNSKDLEVVGIVGDVHQTSIETDPVTEIYIPVPQGTVAYGELVIRTDGAPYAVLPAVKAAVLAVMPDVPLRNVRTLDEVVGRRVAQRKLNMLLLGLFGLLGLVISAVGIYGVMAYIVEHRTREIGVRMALGASRASVVKMMLVKAAVMVAIGLTIGAAGAWYLRSAAGAFLFRLDSSDPRAFVAAVGVLTFAALLASVIPARRAASVDPMTALRAD